MAFSGNSCQSLVPNYLFTTSVSTSSLRNRYCNRTPTRQKVLLRIQIHPGSTAVMHRYACNAVKKSVQVYVTRAGGHIIGAKMPFPVSSHVSSNHDIITAFSNALELGKSNNRKVRLAVIDHITSMPTDEIPVKELVEMCRQQVVDRFFVDAAHTIGSIQADVQDIGSPHENPNRTVVNPYIHFGQRAVWPRGLPLENMGEIKHEEYYTEVCGGKQFIQQGISNGLPDVDSFFFYFTKKPDLKPFDIQFDEHAPKVAFSSRTNSTHEFF